MSEAFLEALSMALRLAKQDYVLARGRKRECYEEIVPGTLLARVTLGESGIESVGERELGEVLGDIILHLVRLEASYIHKLRSARRHF